MPTAEAIALARIWRPRLTRLPAPSKDEQSAYPEEVRRGDRRIFSGFASAIGRYL